MTITRSIRFAPALTVCAAAVTALAFIPWNSPLPPQTSIQPAAPQPAADDLAAELDRRFSQDIAPLIATYCLPCHTGDDAPADLCLDTLKNTRSALAGDVDLRKLRELVASGEMPPKDKAKAFPSDHQRLTITQWLDAALAYVPADAPIDPGWFTIHRLNRTEYRNTLRDLLGLDTKATDLAAKLPRDDTGYGFDNIADVLSVSPVAIEQYLAAAETAIDKALGPVIEFGDHPRPPSPLQAPVEGTAGNPLPRGGYFLYSNGHTFTTFTFPVTGEYMIRVRAWETHGGDANARLSLRVGNRSVGEFDVTGTKGKPQELHARVRVEVGVGGGERPVSAYFTNDYYVKDVADRNLAVESITVAGPLDEKTTERPAQWTRIFAPAANKKGDTARAEAILRAFATRAYRRPATPDQVRALMKVYAADRKTGRPFEPAIRTALTAVLVSPSFLFRTVAHPDAGNPAARYTLDGYELASRLSYFLWSSAPDEPLLAAAADKSLISDAALAAQVKRMLADPRSAAFVENFSGQWLQLRSLDRLAIDRARFPDYTDQLRADMISEATLFFADALASNRSVLDFVDCRETFLNQRLAAFYGLPEVAGDDFRKVSLPESSPRGGVLTMAAVLTLTSNTTRTSPVKRGLFVLDQMLGAPPPPPPPDIPPLEQAGTPGENATVRQKLAAHTAVAGCAVCHNRLDPLGFTFENFDPIGRWRDTDSGQPIDSTGQLPGGIKLSGVKDLKRTILSRSDQFVEALSARVLTYALGRGVEPFDRPAVRKIALRTRAGADRFQTLIESVVLSETFRTCRGRKLAHE